MRQLFLASVLGALVFSGCDKKETPPPQTTKGEPVINVPGSPITAELSCAHCQYKMAGVTACAPAVKVAGKTYLLSGSTIDATKEGLCTTVKQATLEGKIEGDKFVASKVNIK